LAFNSDTGKRIKRRRLREIEPYKVDLVDRAANKRKFIVFKEEAMTTQNLEPELVQGAGGDLHNPETASDLERAAVALEGLTGQIGELVSQLKNDGGQDSDGQNDVDKAASAISAVFREVAEKGMSICQALEQEGVKVDMKKVYAEATALIELLKGVMKKYPSPAPEQGKPAPDQQTPAPAAKSEGGQPPPPPVVEPPTTCPGPMLREVAEEALGMASLTGLALVEAVKAFAGKIKTLAESFKISKSETAPTLPEGVSAADVDMEEALPACAAMFRAIAEQLGIVAKVAGEAATDSVAEPIAAEIAAVRSIVDALAEKLTVHTEKAKNKFAVTLREVAERALSLSQKAQQANFNEPRAMKELKQISILLQGLVEKYPKVKKSDDLELSELGMLLNADQFLSSFEEQLHKHQLLPTEPIVKPVIEPVIEPPVVNPSAGDPPVAPPVEELLAKMQSMQKQIGELQALVAKARGTVPAPASAGEPPASSTGSLLFPNNYNSPAYREALTKRAKGEN
jgi:hypothetical protein